MAKGEEGVFVFDGFRGLRNNVAADGLETGDLEAASNVEINDAGDMLSRKGNSPLKIVGARHSLFAYGQTCLVVNGASLNRVKPDYSEVALRTDMATGRPLSYSVNAAGRIFYTNGVQMGVVENSTNRTLGLDVPGIPTAAAFPGQLSAGRYGFVFTYVRNDKQEGGAGPMGAFTVAAGGGIQLTNCPVSSDPTVVEKNVYVTKANGDEPWLYSTLPAGATTALIVDVKNGLQPLKTQFLGPPPVGDIMAVFGAYLLVAQDNILYPSEPYAHELFDRRKGIAFESRICTVVCMTDGVHLGTLEKHTWLAGRVPAEWTYNDTADYGSVPGSLAFASKSQTGKGEQSGIVAFWVAANGTVCMGEDGGGFHNLTEARYAFPAGDRGAGLVRKHRGMNQFIGVMHGVTTDGNRFN